MKNFLILIFVLSTTSLFSQPWVDNLKTENKTNNLNYFEIVESFNKWWGDKEYQRGSGFKQFKRWEYLNYPRCYPDGQFPEPGVYWKSYQNLISSTNKSDKSEDISNWTPLGLISWENGPSGYNPGNGRVNCVAVSPHDSLIIFIGSASGGAWKSIDGGQSWNTTTDNLPHLGVSAIVFHPDSNNIVFMGTGDRDAGDTKSSGIYKSLDGGNTWLPSGLNTISWNSVNKIIFNPINKNSLLAATNNGVFKSYDGGNSWSIKYSLSSVKDVLFHPTDTNIIYGSGSSFIRSSDGGESFIKNSQLVGNISRLEIAVTNSAPNYVYVVGANNSSSFRAVWRSTDSGVNFDTRATTPNLLGYETDGSDNSGQGWFDLAIAVSPTNPNEVYVGGVNIWKSTDGGQTWQINAHWYYVEQPNYVHADIHYLGFFGNRLYCGSDGGVFYSDNKGNNWIDISEGLGITQFYRFASSAVDANFIVGGTQDNGSNRLQNGIWTHVFGADGMQPMTHRTNKNIFYTSYQFGGLMKTTDNGVTMNYVTPAGVGYGDWVTPFAMHPTDSEVIYAAYNKVYQSFDGGNFWDPISPFLGGNNNFHHLKVSSVNPSYIFVVRNNTIYYTKNEGANWSSKTLAFNGTITGITLSYNNPELLWVCASSSTSDKVFRLNGLTNPFEDISANLTQVGLRSIVHQKNSHDALFVGTENGVFYKDTTMTNWIPFVNGLPNVRVEDLEINYQVNRLRAGTYGRGIWETVIPITANINEISSNFETIVYPNPSNGIFFIENQNGKPLENIYIFDVNGKILQSFNTKSYKIEINFCNFVSGIYFVKIKNSNNEQNIHRVLIYN